MKPEQLFAAPFGFEPGDERRLRSFLEDENWAALVTVLTDAVAAKPDAPARWYLLLAFARFRDGAEVMLDEQLVACREALQFLDEAEKRGESFESVSAIREEVEVALADVSRAELLLLSKIPDAPPYDAVPSDVLADAAFALWTPKPARAAALFDALAQRLEPTHATAAALARLRASLCRVDAGDEAAVKQLDAVHALDWAARALKPDRAVAEQALTTQLVRCAPAEFDALYEKAVAIGAQTGLPFPSVWPNQERLLARCVSLGRFERAIALSDAIEVGREVVPNRLRALMRAARERRSLDS